MSLLDHFLAMQRYFQSRVQKFRGQVCQGDNLASTKGFRGYKVFIPEVTDEKGVVGKGAVLRVWVWATEGGV